MPRVLRSKQQVNYTESFPSVKQEVTDEECDDAINRDSENAHKCTNENYVEPETDSIIVEAENEGIVTRSQKMPANALLSERILLTKISKLSVDAQHYFPCVHSMWNDYTISYISSYKRTGPTLAALLRHSRGVFSKRTASMLAIDVLMCIRMVHSVGRLVCNLGPELFTYDVVRRHLFMRDLSFVRSNVRYAGVKPTEKWSGEETLWSGKEPLAPADELHAWFNLLMVMNGYLEHKNKEMVTIYLSLLEQIKCLDKNRHRPISEVEYDSLQKECEQISRHDNFNKPEDPYEFERITDKPSTYRLN